MIHKFYNGKVILGNTIAPEGTAVYTDGDKPICTSLEALEESEKLSKEKGLKVGCYLTMRFSAGMRNIREMIADGTLGVYETDRFIAPPGISLNLDCDGSDADAEIKAEEDDSFFFE